MRIFISGPMTGIEDYNFPAFNRAENFIKTKNFGDNDYEVVNPVKICKKYKKETVLSDKNVFDEMVQEELDELKKCDAIYLLDGWQCSKGARKELQFAIENNKAIVLESSGHFGESKKSDNSISALEYESLRDEALSMARTLQKISQEVHECAMCDGREDCGYSSKELMKEICYLIYQSEGYHMLDKYNMKKTVESERKVK